MFSVGVEMKHNIGLEWTELFKTHKWGMCVTNGIIVYEEFGIQNGRDVYLNPLSVNPTKWSNILKESVGKSRRIVWVCLTIL